jgi:hypothetical protein
MEKTATPLKEVCTSRRKVAPLNMQMEACFAACARVRTSNGGPSRVYLLITIQPEKYGFFDIRIFCSKDAPSRANAAHGLLHARISAPSARFFARGKFLPWRPLERRATRSLDENARIGLR